MELRININQANPKAYKAMMALEQFITDSGLDKRLYELIKLRTSQLNHCAFCVDMHAKELLQMNESAERVMLLSVWRESPAFTEQERAVLELTELATAKLSAGIPQEVYERVRAHFDEKQFIDLLMAINTINAWNRIGVATGMFPGCFS